MRGRIHVVVCALGLTTACGHDAAPSSPTAQPQAPAAQPQPYPTAVRIIGPLVIAPGEPTQYSLIANLSDGTTRDVAAEATWRVSDENSAGLTITNGLVTATTAGQSGFSVSYGPRGQHREAVWGVVSRPPGTGILGVFVSDGTHRIEGVRIEVVDGSFAGTVSTTGSFYGVVGDLRIRVSAPGYVTQTSRVTVRPVIDNPQEVTVHQVILALAGPPFSLSGHYRATLRASNSCTTIPAALAVREYGATVAPDAAGFTVVLGGADFAPTPGEGPANRFVGRIKANVVELDLGTSRDPWWEGENVFGFVERVTLTSGPWAFPRGIRLGPAGSATGLLVDSSTVTATLRGAFEIFDVDPIIGSRTSLEECFASDHQFVLTRQ